MLLLLTMLPDVLFNCSSLAAVWASASSKVKPASGLLSMSAPAGLVSPSVAFDAVAAWSASEDATSSSSFCNDWLEIELSSASSSAKMILSNSELLELCWPSA